jgi:hypothetical protein
MSFGAAGSETMRIDSSGNVGIGTASPSEKLQVDGNIRIGDTATGNNDDEEYSITSGGQLIISANDSAADVSYSGLILNAGKAGGAAASSSIVLIKTNDAEAMRIDSSGNLLVGKTSGPNYNTVGIDLTPLGEGQFTGDGRDVLTLNRLTSDGDILIFRNEGALFGKIGSDTSGLYVDGQASHSGVQYAGVNWLPRYNGASADNTISLGVASVRFDNIFATNGTIQTSDRNEKQDIEALTDAETRVAVAAKGLLRKFRWQSAVASKGDEARIHFGIIAQDLQDAFTAEGLDASDYGMFCSDTWTDDDGVEQTRLGVRYSELLAFIIAGI